jgi:hypothetical protein
VPVVLTIGVYWFGLRSAKRHDEHEREERERDWP